MKYQEFKLTFMFFTLAQVKPTGQVPKEIGVECCPRLNQAWWQICQKVVLSFNFPRYQKFDLPINIRVYFNIPFPGDRHLTFSIANNNALAFHDKRIYFPVFFFGGLLNFLRYM